MTIFCEQSHQVFSEILVQKTEQKLQMSDVLCELLGKKKPCSMDKAAALAPTMLEMLSRFVEDGVDLSKIIRAFWGSGVVHVDEINDVLPEIIKKWSRVLRKKGLQYIVRSVPFSRSKSVRLETSAFQDLKGIEYVECKSLREEALAALMRTMEVLKNSKKRVSIISDNLALVKMILSLSKIWDLEIDNRFGSSLREVEQIDFMRLIFETVRQNFVPAHLLALLRHSMFSFGGPDFDLNALIAELEIKYLRGVRRYDGLDMLIELIPSGPLKIFLWLLHKEFKGFIGIMSQTSASFQSILKELNDIAIRLSLHKEDLFYSGIDKIAGGITEISPDSFLKIFDIFLLNERFCLEPNEFMRVRILSLEDSKSIEDDYVILTGMNEETLCGGRSYDTGTIRAIYEILGIDHYDSEFARIEAFFVSLTERRDLLLTRTSMINGSSQTPSRLLSKLELVAIKLQETNFYNTELILEVRSLYAPSAFIQQPKAAPVPPVKNRLKRLSVTQIEKLIRDPYSVYAGCILKLRKLEEVDKNLDQLDFGKFIHGVIERFSGKYVAGKDELYYFKELMFYGQMQAESMINFPAVRIVWIVQLKKIASWIINFEKIKRKRGIKIYPESRGEMKMCLDDKEEFTLSCKADRIEIDGKLATIIDFKTGGAPSKRDVFSGTSPQLPLEALILFAKGFNGVPVIKKYKVNVEELSYITLSSGMKFGNIVSFRENIKELVSEARAGLEELIAYYSKPTTPFLICPNPELEPAYNAYSHLERKDG